MKTKTNTYVWAMIVMNKKVFQIGNLWNLREKRLSLGNLFVYDKFS